MEKSGKRECSEAKTTFYTQKLTNFMKVWSVYSEDTVKPHGFSAVIDRHIPYLLFLDGFSVKKE
ncbi:MAG TPA: hypothetical protein DCZ48_07215 [Methylococcaceae bacterium]|nr:hypothetical protein [Methylococcaceae bacterium]